MSGNATTAVDYDKAEMNLRTAEAELKYAEAELATKKVDLRYTEILAPFDGYVGFKQYSVGNMVGPSLGALARITAAGNVKIYFSIDELTLLKINEYYPKAKQNVNFAPKVKVILQNGKEFTEKVWISAWNNMVEDGTFKIQATAENAKRLLVPGQYVKVNLQVSPKQKHIMVRQESIIREQLGTFVYVVNAENKIERRRIETGTKNGEYQVVVSGLQAGERVVVEGIQKAHQGDEVKPITAQQTDSGKDFSTPAQQGNTDGAATPAPEKKDAAK
ncbi:MAG: efflux RND transporter periplasmic adaptor subunit, partial [Victivallales bacterium]|nr:efflux RND transporter periplasmic adaptor subunit [Victivallales bacterium]